MPVIHGALTARVHGRRRPSADAGAFTAWGAGGSRASGGGGRRRGRRSSAATTASSTATALSHIILDIIKLAERIVEMVRSGVESAQGAFDGVDDAVGARLVG